MALTCGIIGLANTGKTTIFNCMSNAKAETTAYAFAANKSNIGIVNVADPRLEAINKFIGSRKVTPVTIDVVDIPGLAKGSSKGEGVGNQFLADVQQTDALIHVLRCFDDEQLPHIEVTIDPARDMEIVDFELQARDLDLVERKIQRMEKLIKIGDKDGKLGKPILQGLATHIENFGNVRDYEMDIKDKVKFVNDMYLLTDKPMMYVCNVDDESAINGNDYVKQVQEALKDTDAEILIIAGAMEAEIAELEEEDERMEFLTDAGLTEASVSKLTRSAYSLLNLMSFFTAGEKEVRAWTIRKGTMAPGAAGAIHSDLERGFIRAEVMKYEDYITFEGSEAKVKEAGKFGVEGKNYVVEDGDIMNIRFNV